MIPSNVLKSTLTTLLTTTLLAIGLSLFNPPTSQATVIWDWSFASEAGTFTTDGNLVGGSAPAATYNITDFAVTTSDFAGHLGSLGGAQYFVSQPNTGFIWDGAQPTQFFRNTLDIILTNGTNYALTNTQVQYRFNPASLTDALVEDGEDNDLRQGPLSLAPIPEPSIAPIPEPSTMLLLGSGLAGLVAWRVRKEEPKEQP